MHSYYAYGLNIDSSLDLPELVSGTSPSDASIYLDEHARPSFPSDEVPPLVYRSQDEVVLTVKGVAVFTVIRGREIRIAPAPTADVGLIRLFLLGTVMSILLFQRGILALHASTVEARGAAIAFLGRSGSGKSSLAAAMRARGYRIVADDVTAVRFRNGSVEVAPGFPQLKLSPEVATLLEYDGQSSVSLYPSEPKKGYRLEDDFATTPCRLTNVYVISEGAPVQIVPLPPNAGLIELVRHTHATRLLKAGASASHFFRYVRLIESISAFRLVLQRSLPSLPEAAAFVEAHSLKA